MSHETWIEWIPNISTGDKTSVKKIARLLQKIPNLHLLHIDRGPDVNRTVFTLAGTKDSLRIALFSLMSWISENIDMSTHTGNHPRMGALDVCPYVLLKGGTQEDLKAWVERLAGDISVAYNFPVYLYEQSAKHTDRSDLADIRRGEYEGLRKKLLDTSWKPDFGLDYNPTLGATVMGVREFLIAYNVNINTNDKSVAQAIAREIRFKGRFQRKYRLPGLKAIGWHLTDAGFCQVSTNITQTRKVTPLEVFNHCRTLAGNMGYRVTGSELIGLIPHHSISAMSVQGSYSTDTLAAYLGLGYCGIEDLKERMIEHKAYLASGRTIFNEIFDPK